MPCTEFARVCDICVLSSMFLAPTLLYNLRGVIHLADTRHFFGSAETDRKLGCLREYLTHYSIALKSQNFSRIYIDAFAGTGSRTETRPVLPFFGETEEATIEVNTPGSARIALGVEPAFHHVVLIEQDPDKVQALKKVISEYPGARALAREGDANEIVQRICRTNNWHRDRIRGVIFLDPYGMEVSWETVTAVANTEALDCWYFFPLSGLYRNASRDPLAIDEGKRRSLTRVLGTDAWRRDWYEDLGEQFDMLGDLIPSERRIADVDRIEDWVHRRLSEVFKGTVLKPLRLKHVNGAPMASLFFAVSNPNQKAVALASRIAGHILKAGI